MKIGVLGSGIVGQTLASGFIKHGYDVMVGTGNPEKLKDWKEKEGGNANIGSIAESASFGDIIVLAVKGKAAKDVLTGSLVSTKKLRAVCRDLAIRLIRET